MKGRPEAATEDICLPTQGNLMDQWHMPGMDHLNLTEVTAASSRHSQMKGSQLVQCPQ
jgi:hypothetical protein